MDIISTYKHKHMLFHIRALIYLPTNSGFCTLSLSLSLDVALSLAQSLTHPLARPLGVLTISPPLAVPEQTCIQQMRLLFIGSCIPVYIPDDILCS